MSYTCKHLTVEEVDALEVSGDVKRLYDDSKDKIENGNYLYDASSDISEDDKYNHWYGLMRNFADGKVNDKSTYTHYCMAVYKDNVLCMLSATYYDSAETSYNYTHALLGAIDGSKSYAFSTEFFTPQATLMKSLGADKMIFYSVKGGSLSFRAITAQASPTLFDYSTINQSEYVDEYEVDMPEEAIATIDGSTKTNDSVKKEKISRDEIKTVRYLK